MKNKLKVLLVDAFTSVPGKGNRAGVVLDAGSLSADQMQAVAALVNVSETAFMIPVPEASGYELQVRYFTPATEVPTCGHATVGAHYARAKALGLSDTTVTALIGAGVLPVEIIGSGADMKIIMTQGEVVFSELYSDDLNERIISALGLSKDDIEPGLPIQEVSTGHSKIMVPIRSVEKLNSLTPDMQALVECSSRTGCGVFFVFTINKEDSRYLTSARMFAPAIGIEEDPVTGNGNGPCGAYLSKHGRLPAEDVVSYRGQQGVAMGKEGEIEVTVHRDESGPYKVQIGGVAVEAGGMDIDVFVDEDGVGAVRV